MPSSVEADPRMLPTNTGELKKKKKRTEKRKSRKEEKEVFRVKSL